MRSLVWAEAVERRRSDVGVGRNRAGVKKRISSSRCRLSLGHVLAYVFVFSKLHEKQSNFTISNFKKKKKVFDDSKKMSMLERSAWYH